MELKYSYSDVSIIPSVISYIRHRSECNPYDESGNLPLFTAPMDSVVSMENIDLFKQNRIIPIIPRTVSLEERLSKSTDTWIATGLEEFMEVVRKGATKILIDIANGHMSELYNEVVEAKKINPNIKVMVGNIANPETIRIAINSGVDYIRVGIGAGRGCITSSNTGIHYPMASLMAACKKVKGTANIKIVADGGIRGYSDVIKALALGADYVMVGSVFTKMVESAAPTYYKKIGDIDVWRYLGRGYPDNIEYSSGVFKYEGKAVKLKKEFWGMASKRSALNKKTTAEGISVELPVEYTMESWTKNLTDYLRSAMSYCNSNNLSQFIGHPEIVVGSQGVTNSLNK